MAWSVVQSKTGSSTAQNVTAALDAPPADGNPVVAFYATSNELGVADDGWVLASQPAADFLTGYGYVGTAQSITRRLTVADETVWIIAELTPSVFGPLEIVDQSIESSPSENGAGSIAIGPSGTLEMPDEIALAFFFSTRVLSSGTAVFENYTAGFTEIAQVGSSAGADFPVASLAMKVIEDDVAAVSTQADITPDENRPQAILLVLRGLPPVDVREFLSGGSSNADPQLSVGGAKSTHEVDWNTLPGDVSRLVGDTGLVKDFLVYYAVPADSDFSAGLVVSVVDQLTDMTVEIAAPAGGGTASSSGATFSEGPVDLGIKDPGEDAPLWVRFTVPAAVASIADDPFDIAVQVEPL
jgi:hypothetical protein